MFAAVVALLIAPTLNVESQHWSDADTWFAAVLALTGRGRDGGGGAHSDPLPPILHLTSATHPTYNLHLLSAPQSSYILHLTSATHPCYILHLISATRHLSYILRTLKVLIIHMLSCHQPVSNRCTMAIELHKLPHSAAHLTSYYILQHILYCAL